MIELSKEVLGLFREHVLSECPKEACGVVVDGCYYPMENIAEDPTEAFKMKSYPGGNLQAVLHSHPGRTVAAPSAADMIGQEASAVPWGIVWTDGSFVSEIQWFGDQVPLAPLLGRKFIHGVQDCYALVRHDRFLRTGIWIPDFPRDEEWWRDEAGTELLTPENFRKAGYEEIEYKDLRDGDVVLGSIMCERVNHSAVYVGNGLVLHHLFGRASRREPLGRWLKYCKHFLRYTG